MTELVPFDPDIAEKLVRQFVKIRSVKKEEGLVRTINHSGIVTGVDLSAVYFNGGKYTFADASQGIHTIEGPTRQIRGREHRVLHYANDAVVSAYSQKRNLDFQEQENVKRQGRFLISDDQ